MRVDEHTTTIDHVPVFYRTADEGSARPGEQVPTLYLHDALTSSEDWTAFLERSGGLAPDLIGFGRSGKGGHLDFSPEGLTQFVERLLDELAISTVKLVGHGWGAAIGLRLALRDPSRVKRLVLIDAVPLLGGYKWHRVARLWRRPLIGELLMGATTQRQLSRHLRNGTVDPEAWSDQRLAVVWEAFDQGTQRALLRLHRAADETRLEDLGADLASLRVPALVLWGERDPWFEPTLADAYGAALPVVTVKRIPDAGHWPWLDQPQVIDLVVEFVEQP